MYTLHAGQDALSYWSRLQTFGPIAVNVQGQDSRQVCLDGGWGDFCHVCQVGNELGEEGVVGWAERANVQAAEIMEVTLSGRVQLASCWR